jgi:biotin carboxyl carrier protein
MLAFTLSASAQDAPSVFAQPATPSLPPSLLPLMESQWPTLPTVAHDCADHVTEATATLTVPLRNQELLALTFATAEERQVQGTLRIPGRFEWMPDAEVVYATPVRGRVTLRVRPPQRVNAGDVLFALESPEWAQEENELAMLRADAKAAKTRLELMQKRLAALKDAGRRDAAMELEVADAEAAAQRAELEAEGRAKIFALVESQLSREGDALVVRAKSRGTVHSLATKTGAWLDAGGEVLTIAENKVWFRADANTREVVKLRDGQKAFVEVAGTRMDAALEMGLPEAERPRVTPVFGIVKDGLVGRAGTLCVVVAESAPRGVAVPEACLAQDGVKFYVIARDAKDATLFHKREVTPGASDGVWTEVEGIHAGEVVVADGVYLLNLAMPIGDAAKATPAGHFHADGKFHEGNH